MKKFVACLLALSMSFATIGCGGEEDDADPAPANTGGDADPDEAEEHTPADDAAEDAGDT